MKNPIAQAKALAGTWPAAAVLLRLSYWMGKTKIRRGPHRWVVMSRDEWLEETGCTLKEYTNAIKRLKEAGLVTAEYHLYRGKRHGFFRLTDLALNALKGTAGSDPEGTLHSYPVGTPIKEPSVLSEVKKGDKKVSSGSSPATEPNGCEHEDGTIMKISETLAAQAAKKHLHKPDTVKQLEFVWKETFADVYEQSMVHVTKKQLGQMKHFLAKCPEGTAAKVLEWSIRNWVEFVKDVETKAGIKSTPSHPSIDFLLKHAWIAVALATSSKLPGPEKQEASPGLPAAKTVQLISQPEEDDQPKSFEELMAILGSGDGSEK